MFSDADFHDRSTWKALDALHPMREHARPLHILMVATESPPVHGGIARVVGSLHVGLQQRGHRVDVLAYPEVGRWVFGEVRLSGLVFKLPNLARSMNKYDIIHVHGITPTVSDVLLLFSRLFCSHIPIVYTHHVDLDFQRAGVLNTFYNRLHHLLSGKSDAVIAATHDTLSLLGSGTQGFVIPFGIDSAYFRPEVSQAATRKSQRFTVLYTGQFRSWKGVRVLMQALSRLPGVRFLLAGHGPEEQEYRALAQKLHLDVEFHIGVRDEYLRRLYQEAHVVVTPSTSRLEAFGLALVEGMAMGCVPVASNLPGVREVVGPVGKLFTPGDVDELTAVLRELCAHPQQVQQMGDRARFYASWFRQEHMISSYETIFQRLIAKKAVVRKACDR